MAVDMFINIDGIKGEATDSKHKGEIDILSWSWGASNSGTMQSPGTGGGAGKANFNDLSFTKFLDLASPMLLKACSTGEHIKKSVLVVRKAGGKDPLDYLIITLEDCLISSVSTGGSGGE
jgi:type VI secretion system secreted protein Hcp